MEKRSAKVSRMLALSVAVAAQYGLGGIAFAHDHDCCIKILAGKGGEKAGVMKGTVKHFDAEKDSITIEVKDSKTVETFQLMHHLKQKDNEYRKFFNPGDEISGKWDQSKEGYRVGK